MERMGCTQPLDERSPWTTNDWLDYRYFTHTHCLQGIDRGQRNLATTNEIGGNMQVGTLVKHIEWEYIGVIMQQGGSRFSCDKWLIHFSDGVVQDRCCIECELEVLCK